MTIQLTKPTYVAGVLEAAGTSHTLAAADEAYFVSSGLATYTTAPSNVANTFPLVGKVSTTGKFAGMVDQTGAVIPTALGTFATTTALEAAYPAASYAGFRAMVGSTEYKSNGTTWQDHAAGHAAMGRGIRTVLIGDSYIDREFTYTTDNRTNQSAWGTFVWANFLLGSPFNVVKEMGIGGERTTDILARVNLVAQYNPAVIFLSCGINDLKNTRNSGSSVVTGEAYADDSRQVELPYVQEKYAAILTVLRNTGAKVFVMSITPPGNSASIATKWLSYRTALFNKWLKYKCDELGNTYFIDANRTTTDPASATGDVKSGHFSDGIHKSITGALASGRYLAAVVKPMLGGQLADRLPQGILDTYSNLVVAGTAVSCDGTTLTVTINNLSGANRVFQPGDRVCVGVPSAGHTEFNGVYDIATVSDTAITAPCSVAASSYTGTVNVSNGTQFFANPLFATQTGGGVASGITLTAGLVPGFTTISGPAGSSVTVTYEAHTNLDGVADGFGSWFVADLIGGANANVKILFATAKSNPATAYSGRIFPGDVITAVGDIDCTAASGVYTIAAGMTLNYKDSAGDVKSGTLEVLQRSTGSTEAHPNEAFRGSFETCAWETPSGALAEVTTVDGQINVVFGAAGGTCTIKIGRFGIYRVDNAIRDASEPGSYQ